MALQLNTVVLLAAMLMQMTVSTAYYFSAFRPIYMRLVDQRAPAYGSSQLPQRPLRSLLGTAAASLALTVSLNVLAVRFEVDSWQEGLRMAAVLFLIDACLNARHHFFEGRPLSLFLLHSGYHAMALVMLCCTLAVFGHPPHLGSSSSGGGSGLAANLPATPGGRIHSEA